MNENRFTQEMRDVLTASTQEAERLKHAELDDAHLLLGILQADCMAGRALAQNFDLPYESVLGYIEAQGKFETRSPHERIRLSFATKFLLEQCVEIARMTERTSINSLVLLDALANYEQGFARQILTHFGYPTSQSERDKQIGEQLTAMFGPAAAKAAQPQEPANPRRGGSLLNLHSNIIYQRLSRQHRWPSLRVTVVGFALLYVLISLLLTSTIVGFPRIALVLPDLIMIGQIVSGGLFLLIPPCVALIASQLTARDIVSGTHALLTITPISKDDIVWGYLAAALYRMRVLIGLLIAILPLYLTGASLIIIEVARRIPTLVVKNPYGIVGFFDLTETGLLLFTTTGHLWFSANVGVASGLFVRQPVSASIIASLISLASILLSTSILILSPFVLSIHEVQEIVYFILQVSPWVLGLLILRRAQLWA